MNFTFKLGLKRVLWRKIWKSPLGPPWNEKEGKVMLLCGVEKLAWAKFSHVRYVILQAWGPGKVCLPSKWKCWAGVPFSVKIYVRDSSFASRFAPQHTNRKLHRHTCNFVGKFMQNKNFKSEMDFYIWPIKEANRTSVHINDSYHSTIYIDWWIEAFSFVFALAFV